MTTPPAETVRASPHESIVIIVDPYSTGCMIAQEIAKRGYHLMALWTKNFADEMKTHVPVTCAGLTYFAELDDEVPWTLEDTERAVRQAAGHLNIIGCIAGGEAGVDFADVFSERLGVMTNGTDIANRRDKKVQQELIKANGIRSVRQAGGSKFEEVEDFLKTERFPVVLKPVDSAGSDGVKLCHDMDDARQHFRRILEVEAVNGGFNTEVLCQEFLQGKEYVIDHVSCNGVHKTMNVWVYDKRPKNGSAFVYFGLIPVDPESVIAKTLIAYIRGVLDVLGIKNGPSHGEAIITQDGPCLVEMNCRAHGADGSWAPLARAINGGYSQIEASADAFLEPEQFARLPDLPPSPLKASGLLLYLVSFSKGTVQSCPGYDVFKKLPSFVSLSPSATVGSKVDYTVDLITCPGLVVLVNSDEAVMKKDLETVRYLEEINALYVYESHVETLSRPSRTATSSAGSPTETDGSFPKLLRMMSNDHQFRPLVKRMTTMDASKEVVVVVDPYSTGCVIVKEILARGFSVIALWTKDFSEEMKKHVPIRCGDITYHAHVNEEDNLPDTVRAVYKAAGALRIVACIAGGEAGVDCADSLSERLEVRTNGTNIANRRDKRVQQELINAKGLRSVRQACGSKFEEVEDFLQTEQYPLVLKPVDSAGSDGVKLCHNLEEAKVHFHRILEVEAVNGGFNTQVLCQEFLRGKEYVIDHVSRDGEHKTMVVYQYDKRPANGSAFVYFGTIPVDVESPEGRILIPYVRAVLDALELKNGPSHGEVIITPNGPCLVEMNCRAHGKDGNWRDLARGLTGGYSQIEASVDSYLDMKQFSILPDLPPSPMKAAGQEVSVVSYSRGTVKSMPGYDVIRNLESFVYMETGIKEGSVVEHTVDLATCIASVILMHADPAVLEADLACIRQLEKSDEIYEYENTGAMFKAASSLDLASLSMSDAY